MGLAAMERVMGHGSVQEAAELSLSAGVQRRQLVRAVGPGCLSHQFSMDFVSAIYWSHWS